MAKVKTKFFCTECGYETPKWMGKCPGCGEWNTMVEERETVIKTAGVHSSLIQTKEKPQSIIHIESGREPRLTTTLSELNRVLGGGVVPGSLILVGGDPGIGKSTLLLQTSNALAASGLKVLYVSGEESMRQTKLRADRLGVLSENLFVSVRRICNISRRRLRRRSLTSSLSTPSRPSFNLRWNQLPGVLHKYANAQAHSCASLKGRASQLSLLDM